MTEPLPNCFSICPSAALSAFLRFSSIMAVLASTAVSSGMAALSHNGLAAADAKRARSGANALRLTPMDDGPQRPGGNSRVARTLCFACTCRLKFLTLRQIERVGRDRQRCGQPRPLRCVAEA